MDTAENRPTYVVGIGASAGGLEPLEAFFAALPTDTGMAFAVVQHLSPDFESRMDELLGRQTSLRIRHVRSGDVLEPNTVYLAPPRKEIILSGGAFLLTDVASGQAFTLPIDQFFRSLANEVGARAVAVVLSGSGSDGSRGVREVHEAGGLVIAQEPETAKFDSMPRSAIETGAVDLVLDSPAIPVAIVEHQARSGQRPVVVDDAPKTGLDEIFRLLRGQYGIDFAHYKPTTVLRRVERRFGITAQSDLEDYASHLRESPSELDALYHDLLIGVTRFFRDPEAFAVLERDVVPAVLSRNLGGEVRVWVPACATGEEAYSLAMLFHERLEQLSAPPQVRIFATDVHTSSIERAGEGVYGSDVLEGVSAERRARYFRSIDDDRHRVTKELREMIVFARQNVVSDAPFTRIDLVSCRNFLIYLQPPAQKKVLSLFHFAMKTGGLLFLGPSETPGPVADEFEAIDRHWKVYRKRRDVRLPVDTRISIVGRPTQPTLAEATIGGRRVPDTRLMRLYDRLLAAHMPTSFLVDEKGELLHTFGGTDRLLRVPPGRVSTNVADLLPAELRTVVASGLQRAARTREGVVLPDIEAGTGPERTRLRLTIEPLPDSTSRTTDYLVSFERLESAPTLTKARATDGESLSRDYVESLETDLRFARENLQSTIEELETSNEELQATNEELVAANEELQSTNEELHSVNEELYTVNVEHQKQIATLRDLTADMDNLLQSIEVGVVFLDTDLRIRRFTPKAAPCFRLLPQDLGRRFDDFAHSIVHAGLMDDVRAALAGGRPIEREVTTTEGDLLFLRILPYRTRGETTGVVLTSIDIKSLKTAQQSVRQLSAIVESSTDAIVSMDLDGIVRSWNKAAEVLYGHRPEEIIGRPVTTLVAADRHQEVQTALRRAAEGDVVPPFETVGRRKNGHSVDVWVSFSGIRDDHDTLFGVSVIARDITARRQAEQQVQRSVQQRDQFLAMLSHELRNPLMGMLTASELLGQDISKSKRADACNVIRRQTQQMARLLDDLLDVSRMRRDKIEMRVRRFVLQEIVPGVLDAVRARAQDAELELEVSVPDAPVWIDGDRARLQQLAVNLLANAIKFTPTRRCIRLAMSADEDTATIEVSDEGLGIPPELLDVIFEPFRQGAEPLRDGAGGMGLGLALVRSIAQGHGGDVTVTSGGHEKGSTFTVRIPRVTATPETAPLQGNGRQRHRRILLVDDQIDNLDLLALALSQCGYEVIPASTGAAALEVLAKQRPSLAIVDIGLPDMLGTEVARVARERFSHDELRLIALTGHGQQRDREAVLEAGFDEHLVKPVPMSLLLEMIDSVTGRRAPPKRHRKSGSRSTAKRASSGRGTARASRS